MREKYLPLPNIYKIYPTARLDKLLGFHETENPRISRQSADEDLRNGRLYHLVMISIRG